MPRGIRISAHDGELDIGRGSRRATLKLRNLDGCGPWRVKDAVGGAVLAESAAPADLEKGLRLTIPPQERVVLVLENNKDQPLRSSAGAS